MTLMEKEHLPPEDQETYTSMVLQFQRQINCLSDPDRFVRKRSLIDLEKKLVGSSTTTTPVLQVYFHSHLKCPLSACLDDPIEKCREVALSILSHFCIEVLSPDSVTSVFPLIISRINGRIGALPFKEPSEEVRLQLLSLVEGLLTVLPQNEEVVFKEIDTIANILSKSCLDHFPDSKKVCSKCGILLGAKFPQAIKLSLGTMVTAFVQNLGHQHSRVRNATLQALEQLLPCGCEGLEELMEKTVLPCLPKLAMDRTASVRKQTTEMLATWLDRNESLSKFESDLFAALLSMISDDSEEVQGAALHALEKLAPKWEQQVMSDTEPDSECSIFGFGTAEGREGGDKAAFPFKTRPSRGARAMCRRLLGDILPDVLRNMQDWTVDVRAKAALTLRTIVILAEDAVNAHLDRIVAVLAKTCTDDEEAVVANIHLCVEVLGQYTDQDALLGVLLPLVSGKVSGQNTAQHRVNALALLAMSLRGMKETSLAKNLPLVSEALIEEGLRDAQEAALQERLGAVLKSLVAVSPSTLMSYDNDTVPFRMFWILNHLLATTPHNSVVHTEAIDSLIKLAQCLNSNVEDLYFRYFRQLLEVLHAPTELKDPCWEKGNVNQLLFDEICRRGHKAWAQNLQLVVPILLNHLHESREADIRLSFLALLETMLGVETVCKEFIPYIPSLIIDGILPSIVWKGGKVAATVRKVAMACMYTLLRHGLATKDALYQTAARILPVLKSCLDDGDAKTRQLVCLALQYLFTSLPNALGEEPVYELYAEILKRLDDSNNTVRMASCEAFIMFLHAAPKTCFSGTIVEYSLDCLFVHLDDPEREVQDVVFRVIKELLNIDPKAVSEKAAQNRSRHRNPRYCDELIELAQS